MKELTIIGGGLAGCEAAWQAAKHGIHVRLYEMRPGKSTGAHQSANLAELVCSNSLGSSLVDRASGLLKHELHLFRSLLLTCAKVSSLPAGNALAVDRENFSKVVTEYLSQIANISIIREEITQVPNTPTIIASGPLTSPTLSRDIQQLTGFTNLYFHDAIAPIVTADSINWDIAFRASRRAKGEEGDYINCPFNKQQYDDFVNALSSAKRIQLKEFEENILEGVNAGPGIFFEGCLPIEIIAIRGHRALAFGPLRPIGLTDPRTKKGPYAVLQLRQENLAGSLYNLVGCQTNLTVSEQKRVFQMIPGLENAEFIRFGQMHRNTFINSPLLLDPTLQYRQIPGLFFAGQITGVEGYMGNIATGLLAGINASRYLNDQPLLNVPLNTMIGSLVHYITHADSDHFQPMKANFGILPPLLNPPKAKRDRASLYASRSLEELSSFIKTNIPSNSL